MRGMSPAAVVLCVALVAQAHASTNLLSNGSFELYDATSGYGSSPSQLSSSFWTLPAGSTAIKDWLVVPNGVDWIYTYWPAQDGLRSVDLSGNQPGGVSQAFATTPGRVYDVNFWVAGNKDGPPEAKTVDVTVAVGAYENVFTWVGARKSDWKEYTFWFTATGTTSTLKFVSTTGTAYGPSLDNVRVTESPELPSGALVLLGMVPVGLAWRRRRR